MGAAESTLKPSLDFDSSDLYEVLRISEDASEGEIKRAFRQRALETHPDKNLNDMDAATKRFSRVQEAYETLSDPMSRAVYNHERENSPPKETRSKQPNAAPDFMPGQFGTQGQGGTPPPSSSLGGRWPYGLFYWIFWFFSCFGILLPKSWTEPSDPFLRYIPEEYIARNKYLQRPQGISAKDIREDILLAMEKATWDENGRDQSLFTLLRNLFKCLAYDELRWGNTEYIPDFGCGHSAWCVDDDPRARHYAQDFYEYWLNFKTRKPFDWVNPYYTNAPNDPRAQRHVAKKNREIHRVVQDEYNEFIQTLADILLRCDPRFMAHVYIRFHMDGKPPSNDFYKKFVKRCRTRANRSQASPFQFTNTQPAQPVQPEQPEQPEQLEQLEQTEKTKTQSRNERRRQSQRNKAKQKKSW